MAHYKLVENLEHHARYDLLCDDKIILSEKFSEELYEYLYTVIKSGDTFQEVHYSRYEFPTLNYENILEQKRRDQVFRNES